MSKKELKSVTADLASLAEQFPSQKPTTRRQSNFETPASSVDDPVIQFSLSMRKNLRKELMQMALNADMTMRAYVLNALKEKGLNVTEEDLADKRKR